MLRTFQRGMFPLILCTFFAAAPAVIAGEPLSFHVSGDGVFNPANIGTSKGGNAGLVLGDGSGLAPYKASGTDFVLGGVDLGAIGRGSNVHRGAAQSFTEGTLGDGIITWPVVTGPNPFLKDKPRIHVMRTDFGDIHFTYAGRFILDLGTGVIIGQAPFKVVGGTGLFEDARGVVLVQVNSTGADPAGGVDFHYEFDGLVILDD
jgi:hypothetical protein